jgi:phytoene/squalene synthetase
MEVERTQKYFHDGAVLVDHVPGWLRVDVELFVRGGMATLEAIRQVGYDVLRRRPRVSRWKQLGLLAAAWTRRWRRFWQGCREQ